LQRVIDSVAKSRLIDEVIIAAPHIVPSYGMPLFVGDEEDVLKRYYDCATFFKGDIIVRITSDCPLLDTEIVDTALYYMLKRKLPYVCFAPLDGLDVEVFTYKMLKEAHYKAKSAFEREHVTPYMRRVTKVSVDTQEDLKRVRSLL